MEDAATAGLARDLDVAAALLDDPVGAREPKARALADALRREEGIEDPVADLVRHSAALVLDGDDDVPAGFELAAEGLARADVRVVRPDRQRASVGHRVARVQGEVKKHLLHLDAIGPDGVECRVEHGHELDPLAENVAQHRDGLGDERIQLEWPQVEGLAPAEREQLPGQRRGALRA